MLIHSKIIRKNGDRYQIEVEFNVYIEIYWEFRVYKCEKGKRTFNDLIDRNDYTYRGLNIKTMSDRRKHDHSIYLQHVTEDEVMEVLNELYEQMKPKIYKNLENL